ncbi:hypothetical protein ACIBVK_28605 [Micromonospora echinofusca]|uniref:hypothetical protein n=1 Tax=Micromonospora echinofusca TaxID=47858 RepID=UPI0037AE4D0E
MTGTRWTSTLALATLALVTGCTGAGSAELPARVASVPAEVRGLGPAVLAVPVPDDRRGDLTGLLAVDRFGDDLGDLTPARRHAEIAFGDPRFPTIARGLGDDRRDALLVDGRLRDVTLPDHVFARRVTGIGAALSITQSRCVTVTGDGTIAQPAVEASCTVADRGGVVWQDRPSERYGGIDLATGAACPAIALPSHPIAATPDGRYLAAVTTQRPRRLVIGDTTTGRWRPAVTVSGADVFGTFTSGGFAVLNDSGAVRTISLVTPDGGVRDLLGPVGEVAFAPNGQRAIVVDTRSGSRRLAVLDLRSGTVTPVLDGGDHGGERRPKPAELPPVTGSVTATVSGDAALVVELPPGVGDIDRTPRPSRVWSVRLTTATATAYSKVPEASSVRVLKPTAEAAEAGAVSGMSFQTGGETITLSPDGTVTSVPPGATPRATLGQGLVLHALTDSRGRDRADRLLVTDGSGGRAEVATGAGTDQRVDRVILTPDGAHLLITLRPTTPWPQPGALDAVVVARRDGSGKPIVIYRGVVLTSLGIAPASGT